MKANPLKKALSERRQTYGTWVTLARLPIPKSMKPDGDADAYGVTVPAGNSAREVAAAVAQIKEA